MITLPVAVELEVTDPARRGDRRYAALFDNSIFGMFVSTVDGRCIASNRAVARMLGYDSVEDFGRCVTDVRHQIYRDPGAREELLRRLRRDHYVDGFEYEAKRKDGGTVWLTVTAKATIDAQGRITEVQGILQDVTARKRVEQELLSTRQHLEYVLSTSPLVSYLVAANEDGTLTPLWLSENIVRLTGCSADECLTFDWWKSHIHPDDLARTLGNFASLRHVSGLLHEYRLRHTDDTYRWVRDESRVQVRPESGAREIIGCWSDITERKREEEELERRRAVLAQSEKLADMGSLLAGVAHELNNPLAIVLGQAELLGRDAHDGAMLRRTESLKHAAERCARIVRNFLSLARQRPPERQRVCLNQIVREAIELLAYGLRVDNVEIVLELDSTTPFIWADPHQLHQVLINLLTNAHYAVRRQEGPRQIRVRSSWRAEAVLLTVADNGYGVPATVQGRLFEPFFTTKPQGEGTGLGLSLCRGIVESHAGVIWLDTTATRGATFIVELPVGVQLEEERVAAAEPDRPVPAQSILVVDDEPIMAAVLREMLLDDGHAVDVAANGREALERVRGTRYDLVITDVRMPELDGVSFYRAARALMPENAARFVFMTGDGLTRDTLEFLSQPGRVHLEKPFGPADVRRTISSVLDREPQ
jgi:PAS domain S-box-containing protein